MTSVMVVAELNPYRLPTFPLKAKPPLIVDTDAEASCPFTLQLLQPVARRNPKVPKLVSGIEHLQSSK